MTSDIPILGRVTQDNPLEMIGERLGGKEFFINDPVKA